MEANGKLRRFGKLFIDPSRIVSIAPYRPDGINQTCVRAAEPDETLFLDDESASALKAYLDDRN